MEHYATLHELESIYSYEDVWDMAECIQVDRYNQAVAQYEAQKAQNAQGAKR